MAGTVAGVVVEGAAAAGVVGGVVAEVVGVQGPLLGGLLQVGEGGALRQGHLQPDGQLQSRVPGNSSRNAMTM